MRVIVWSVLAACGGSADPTPMFDDAGPCGDEGAHDEDGDRVGDRCDVCPAAPDPAQLDTTERATMLAFPDGVGDACDPRPKLSGDKLGAFHPFADAADANAWTAIGSGYAITDDAARASGDARWLAKTREQGDALYVQARLAQLSSSAGGAFELALDGNGLDTGVVCTIAKDRDGDGSDELEIREVGGAVATKRVGMEITGPIVLTARRTIDPQRRGYFFCTVTFDGGMATHQVATTDDLAVGLYTLAQTAAQTVVTSVVVYTGPTLPDENR